MILLLKYHQVKCDKTMDKNSVTKVLTLKSGKFGFSSKFSKKKLSHSLVEARVVHDTITDLPILPQFAAEIQEEVIRKSIFGTAAIEGNPLSEGTVADILSNPKRREDGNKRAEREIRNLKAVYDWIDGLGEPSSSFQLTEDLIRKVHSIITEGIDSKYNIPGQYRNHLVKVGNPEHGGIYTPPKTLEDIKTLMGEFIAWISSEELLKLEPPLRAALAHYHLALIHPFSDGNGRTARIIEALLLKKAGIKYVWVMLSNYYYRYMDDYFWAFSNSINSKEYDVTPFLDFALTGFLTSLNEMRKTITFYIRQFALRDYYPFLRKDRALTQRQHDLLFLLLDNLGPFTLKDLFTKPPFTGLYGKASERTARRDLRKLSDKKLILEENGGYRLNYRVLG